MKPNPLQRYKYNDLFEWEGRWELIQGVPYNMTPAPSTDHQRVLGALYIEINSSLKGTACEAFVAPFDVRLAADEQYDNPDNVVQPDITVICDASRVDGKGGKGAPTLVVEILSPSTAIRDRNEKFRIYEQFGVMEYWIVDPMHQTIEVYGLEQGAYRKRDVFGKDGRLASFAFPGFDIELSGVFR